MEQFIIFTLALRSLMTHPNGSVLIFSHVLIGCFHEAVQRPSIPGQWMPAPVLVPAGVPPGLEYLACLDQVRCQQQIEWLEVITGFHGNNRYLMMNGMGQQIFFVIEDSDTCTRLLCGSAREFTLHILDNMQREVIRVYRPFVMCGGLAPCANCCGYTLQVEAPVGKIVGTIVQTPAACTLNFDLCDEFGKPQLEIRGPCIVCTFGTVDFPVHSKTTGQIIGQITKHSGGLFTELFTNAQSFGITWPIDLDVKMKATLIGALFLIDFMVFEEKNDNGMMGAM